MASISDNMLFPTVEFTSGAGKIPVIGLGTFQFPPADSETLKNVILEAIQVGYRHFDTASIYESEKPLGEAIVEALNQGLIKSREELFITSKLWCSDSHAQFVLPALIKTLKNLDMSYVDLYLIHFPVSSKPGKLELPVPPEDFMAMDFAAVWAAMEECQRIGLTKAIGVSNFSCLKLQKILDIAKIQPVVNQVEVNPCWQQKKLREFCKEKGIVVEAYTVLGAKGSFHGSHRVMESQILKQIAEKKGKTVAQVCLRWAYEQDIVVLVKSYNKERIKQNSDIFDWRLTDKDYEKINEIPQERCHSGVLYISDNGPFKTLDEFWDGEI